MSDPSRPSGSPPTESRGEWITHIRSRLAPLTLSPAREAEIIEELSQHLDQRYEELRNRGSSDEDARRLALDELRDRDALAEEMRRLRRTQVTPSMPPGSPHRFLPLDLWQDLRYTTRLLRKQPGFAIAAVLMLALGIGANTAIFSVVNSVLIKPLPYPDPDAVVNVVHRVNGADLAYFSDQVYLAYAENNHTFERFGVWAASTSTVTGGGDPEQVRTLIVSHEVLPALGMRPTIGRWFSEDEGGRGAPPRVLLTDAFWQRRFGGDEGVLRRALTINGRSHQIIGVMPAAFRFGGEPDVLLLTRIVPPGRSVFGHQGVARLKSGVTLEQANADVARMIPMWFKDTGPRASRFEPSLRPLKQDIVGDVGTTLWVVMGTIGIVLLMACANVANLLLVRADARRHEFAVRVALGARWTRIARQLLMESLVLALVGGVVGLAVAYGGLRLLLALAPANVPRLTEISIDPVALGFALALSVVTGLVFGVIPILKHASPRVAALAGAGRGANITREQQRSQHALVVAQVALALVLLVSSGLMIRSFQALRTVDPGFMQPEHIQTFGLFIPPSAPDGLNLEGGASTLPDERFVSRQQQILEKLAAIPGVTSAALTSYLSMDPDTSTRVSNAVEGEGGTNPERHVSRQIRFVSPGFPQTLGIRVIAGADFTWADVYDKRNVALMSENLARELWGSPEAALGKRFRQAKEPWYEVVGVTNDIHDNGVDQPTPAMIFMPARLHAPMFGLPGFLARNVFITIRSERAGTESLLDDVREAVWSVDGTLPLAKVRTLGDLYDRSMARTSFTLVLLAIAAAMALLLGVIGIYGVLSYAVSQRRREIGIRLALGAQTRAIRVLFVRRGLIVAGTGVAIGLAGAAGFTRLMESLLFGISPLDPITFAAMSVVLAVAAVLASYLPTRRAVAIDPVETMRAE
jgi:predicted permease